jgi:uncharacterized protein (DUF58 family)
MRPLAPLRRRLRARAAAWFRRRQGADVLPLVIGQRRVYILPTRAGFGFALLSFVMLLAGLNYGNGLALLLTFTLGGLMLVAMHQCHRNLQGTVVSRLEAANTFAGGYVTIHGVLGNPGALRRWALRLAPDGATGVSADLEPEGEAHIELKLSAPRRGRLRVERLRLDTRYPFGLFEAWTWLHPPLELLVYPRPRGVALSPGRPGAHSGSTQRPAPGTDEWAGLRSFRVGDSPRQVAWTAYARGAPLLVKEYTGAGALERRFDYADLAPLDPEARLEQLCRWVIESGQRGERYALQLPGWTLAPGTGAAHGEKSLRALALHGTP